MKAALEMLGYGPCHHLLEPACQITRLRQSAAILSADNAAERRARLARLLTGYEVSLDVPGSACTEELLALYPSAVVVLTTRGEAAEAWLASYTSIFQVLSTPLFALAAYWSPGAESGARGVRAWQRLYARRFPGADAPPSADMYRRHAEHVRAVTPANRLLEFPVGAGWEPLCAFLRKPVPDAPFPRKNERAYLVAVNRLAVAVGIAAWGLLFYGLRRLRLPARGPRTELLATAAAMQLLLLAIVTLAHRLGAPVKSAALAAVGALLWHAFQTTAADFTGNRVTKAVFFCCLLLQYLRAIDVVLLAPPPPYPPADTIEAFNVLWNMRDIGGPRQIPRIPPNRYSRPGRGPSRIGFLTRHVTSLACTYVLLEVATLAPPRRAAPTSGAEAVLIPVLATAAFWTTLSLFLSLIYDVLAITQVALFLSEPADWPPLFGRITDAWSIRQFWGYVPTLLASHAVSSPRSQILSPTNSARWHQTLRLTLTSHAKHLLHFAGLPSRGTLGRYSCLVLTFAASGMLHCIADRLLGVPWRESGALTFFLLQAAGIVVEDTVQALLAWVPLGRGCRRVVGRLWLATILVLTTPMWMEPTARHLRHGTDVMTPLRIVSLEYWVPYIVHCIGHYPWIK